MKKNIILAIATITTLTLLAGCGAKDTAISAAPVEESKAVEVAEVIESTPEPEATPEPVEVVAEPEVTSEPAEATSEATSESITQTFEANDFGHMVDVTVDDPDFILIENTDEHILLKPSAESDIEVSIVMDCYTTTECSHISKTGAPVMFLNNTLTDFPYEELDSHLVVKAVVDKNYGIAYPVTYPYNYIEFDEAIKTSVGYTTHIECSSPTVSCDELVELCKELYNKITVVSQEECPTAEEYNEKYLPGMITFWRETFNN